MVKNYGFILPAVECLISILNRLNLVEWLKAGSVKFFPINDSDGDAYRGRINNLIDSFIIGKFLFVSLAFFFSWNSCFISGLVIYLLVFNLYTYFYHHVWNPPKSKIDMVRGRKRFLNLGLSVLFSNLSYAYLYAVTLHDQFSWPQGGGKSISLIYSFSKSMFVDFMSITPTSMIASTAVVSQAIITFIFVSIILTTSVPNKGENY